VYRTTLSWAVTGCKSWHFLRMLCTVVGQHASFICLNCARKLL
jgi:hypothetical protein